MFRAFPVSIMVGAVLLLVPASVLAATGKQAVVDDVVVDLKRPGEQACLAAGFVPVGYRPAYYNLTPRITTGFEPMRLSMPSSVASNTVFVLSPSHQLGGEAWRTSSIRHAAVMGVSMGTRIDTRVDARVNARLIGQVSAAHLGFVGRAEPGGELSLWSTPNQSPVSVLGSIDKGMLSIRCTEPTRPATSATTPPVKPMSIESSGANVSR